jgi:hypothetical protein
LNQKFDIPAKKNGKEQRKISILLIRNRLGNWNESICVLEEQRQTIYQGISYGRRIPMPGISQPESGHFSVPVGIHRYSFRFIHMKKTVRSLLSLTLILIFAGCSLVNNQQLIEQTLSPDLATGTAIVARKYTQAAEATIYPATPIPTEPQVTMDWTGWTPSSGEIVASDSGKFFDFWLTSRFSIVLKESDYPVVNLELICNPEVVLGWISNVEPAPLDYYVIRYEGASLGQCIIRNGQFEVTINIVNHP